MLSHFGVLDPSKLVPNSCIGSQGFICDEIQLTEGNDNSANVIFVVKSTLKNIIISDVASINIATQTATLCDDDIYLDSLSINGGTGMLDGVNIPVESNDRMRIWFVCTNPGPDARLSGTVEFDYKDVGGTLEKKASIPFSIKLS